MVGGEVEVDESYHGAKRRRGFHGKKKNLPQLMHELRQILSRYAKTRRKVVS